MSEFNYSPHSDGVPVKVERVFDSCSDKDCLSNLQVTINNGSLPPEINIVRSRAATVENVSINVEPVPFNKGFYSIDLAFTFSLEILGYESTRATPVTMTGTAYAAKNCILYGSESSVRIFSGSENTEEKSQNNGDPANLPSAVVSVLEPIVLETKIGKCCCCPDSTPGNESQRSIYVTLGLFSVVELTRPVTVMVPTMDYTIPRKECCNDSDSPCEVFEKLKFPEEEFSPLSLTGSNEECEELNEDLG